MKHKKYATPAVATNKKTLSDRFVIHIALALFLLFGLAEGSYVLYCTFNSDPLDVAISTGVATADKEFSVMFENSKGSWNNPDQSSPAYFGAEYDGTLTYTGTGELKNWVISFEVPESSYIDSSWNGTYTKDGTTVTVTPLDFNETIAGASSMTFGFVMYSPGKLELSEINFRCERSIKPWSQPLFWILLVCLFTTLVVGITSMLNNVRVTRMKRTISGQKKLVDQALRTFAKIIDAKDEYTCGHSYRVAIYSRELARRYGMGNDECENLYYIALLHDIGKIGIPDDVLSKNGRLSNVEWELIKNHVTIGAAILAEFSAIPGISDGAKYHHEKYDGSGYAFGLRAEDIPLNARIIAVADAYDAMSSARIYRSAMTSERIRGEIEKNIGKQFDPQVARLMLDMIDDGFAPVL